MAGMVSDRGGGQWMVGSTGAIFRKPGAGVTYQGTPLQTYKKPAPARPLTPSVRPAPPPPQMPAVGNAASISPAQTEEAGLFAQSTVSPPVPPPVPEAPPFALQTPAATSTADSQPVAGADSEPIKGLQAAAGMFATSMEASEPQSRDRMASGASVLRQLARRTYPSDAAIQGLRGIY